MNDLIDRQAAITAIQNAYCDTEGGEDKCAVWKNVGLTEALHIMQDLPSAQPEQRWIPCSERLPEPRIDVWCNSDMGQMVGYYEENVETWYGRDYLELMVTAWMPLPEPWRGDSICK